MATYYGLVGAGTESMWGDKSFHAHPEWTLDPFCILYSGSYPGIRQLGCDADHPPTHSAEAANGLELYFCRFVCWHRLVEG
jgi:hypothetical protein